MVHNLETHHCKYCDKWFKTNDLLKVHRFLKCKFSHQSGFWQQDQLLDHYRRCHFLCIHCDPFFSKKTHDSHVKQHAVFCELCPKIPFWSAPDLESHKWIQHGQKWKCQYCEVIPHSPLDALISFHVKLVAQMNALMRSSRVRGNWRITSSRSIAFTILNQIATTPFSLMMTSWNTSNCIGVRR